MNSFTQTVQDLWPVLLFILGIIWKQIVTHFDVIHLKQNVKELEEENKQKESKIKELEYDFHDALKEHIVENKNSNDKLTNAITELVRTTTVLTTKIEMMDQSSKVRL